MSRDEHQGDARGDAEGAVVHAFERCRERREGRLVAQLAANVRCVMFAPQHVHESRLKARELGHRGVRPGVPESLTLGELETPHGFVLIVQVA
jgi:hypothetical protein